MTGARSANLGQNMLLKLKVVYSLTEQLYAGSLRTLVAIASFKKPPTTIKTVLEHLSTVPSQIEEIKLSAARAGALNALSWAKAWQAELDPAEMGSGVLNSMPMAQSFKQKTLPNMLGRCGH